jgi:uncharacterized protein with GYD domain
MRDEIDQILLQAIEFFGADMQVEKTKEELAELLVALQKYTQAERNTSGSDPYELPRRKQELRGELADAWIMLSQLLLIFGNYEMSAIIEEKICSLDLRIKEGAALRLRSKAQKEVQEAGDRLMRAAMKVHHSQKMTSHPIDNGCNINSGAGISSGLAAGCAQNATNIRERFDCGNEGKMHEIDRMMAKQDQILGAQIAELQKVKSNCEVSKSICEAKE